MPKTGAEIPAEYQSSVVPPIAKALILANTDDNSQFVFSESNVIRRGLKTPTNRNSGISLKKSEHLLLVSIILRNKYFRLSDEMSYIFFVHLGRNSLIIFFIIILV